MQPSAYWVERLASPFTLRNRQTHMVKMSSLFVSKYITNHCGKSLSTTTFKNNRNRDRCAMINNNMINTTI